MPPDPTPYPALNAVLAELLTGVRGALGDTLVGAYLQGSFAVGDFDEHSDVDFIVVVRDEPTPAQVAELQAVHGRVYDAPSEWAKHLEGSYVPAAVLRDYGARGTLLWYLDHGSRALVRSDYCNTIVVRWVLREHGIALAGPPAAPLVDPIPVHALRQEIGETMRRFAGEIFAHPERYRNRFYQGYLVLNYCRMLHDLVEGRPGSKRAGAEWAAATLDPSWRALIDRAWHGRPNPAVAVRTPADAADYARTLELVRHIIERTDRYVRR